MPAAAHTDIEQLVKTAQAARAAGDRAIALASFQAAQHLDPDNVQLKLDIATELRALNRSADAAQIYRTIRQLTPDSLAATIGLAQLKSEQKDRDGALELFREAHRLSPQHIGVRLEIGRLLRELGRLDEAESAYAQILQQNPQEVSAAIGHALVHRARHNRESSLAALKAAAKAAPKNTRLRLEIFNDLRHLHRAAEAREILDQIIADEPRNFDARMASGYIRREQGDRLGSLGEFREAATLDPNHHAPKLQAAQDLRELGRLQEAETLINEVLARHADHFDAYAVLGAIKRQQGDRLEAVGHFQRAGSLNPSHVGVKLQAAQNLRELGRLEEAEAILGDVIARQPNSFEAYLGLGHVARQRGDSALALSHFQHAVALNSRQLGPRLQCAQALRELGRLDEAECMLNGIFEIEPNNLEARVGIARIRRSRGDRHASLLELRKAAALDPAHVGIKLEMASDLREIGRVAEAMDVVNAALSIDPNHANANAQLGQTHRAKGHFQKALDSYAKAVTCAPHNLSLRIELANCYRDIGNVSLAETELSKLVAEHPDNVQATVSLAALLIETFRLDEGKSVLNGFEAQKPSVPILVALGRLSRRADRRSEALVFFQRAHQLEPDHSGPLFELLQEHRAQGNFAEALAISEILVERVPSLQALLERGRIHRDQGEREMAIEAFKSAATKYPDAWQAQLELAIEYRLLGEPQETERILKSIVEENGDNVQALDHLIEYLRMAEQFEEALELCLKAISLRPGVPWSYLKAAHTASRIGRTELSWKFLDEAENFAGLHPEIIAARVELLRVIRKFRQAEDFVTSLRPDRANYFAVGVQSVHTAIALGQLDLARERLSSLQPQAAHPRSAVHRLRARILELSWNHEGAIDEYQLSLKDDPHNQGTYHELAKCNLLLFHPSAALAHLRKSLELGKSANVLRGGSHNSSQNHMGQLINEFLLDSDLLAELASLHRLDGSARLTRLMDLVANNPDNTSSAIGLLLELRKTGRLSVQPRRGKLKIPRSIVQFWDNPNLPDEIRELCASWSEFNPDFNYEIFNERSAANFLREHHSPEVLSAFRASREPAQKADLFRLAYLAVHGGFYADCDDRCATNLGEFIPENADFVAYHEEFGTLGNNFIGAVPNHPVICRALDLAVEAIQRNDSDMIWLLTGPGLLTRAYACVATEDLDALLSRSAIFTVGEMQRYLETHCPVTYKLTKRHWLKSTFNVRGKKSA